MMEELPSTETFKLTGSSTAEFSVSHWKRLVTSILISRKIFSIWKKKKKKRQQISEHPPFHIEEKKKETKKTTRIINWSEKVSFMSSIIPEVLKISLWSKLLNLYIAMESWRQWFTLKHLAEMMSSIVQLSTKITFLPQRQASVNKFQDLAWYQLNEVL